MATKTRRAAASGRGTDGDAPDNDTRTAPSIRRRIRKRTGPTRHATNSHPDLGTRIEFACPVCSGGNADATYRMDSRYRVPDWFIGCFSASCRALGGTYLVELAGALALPSNATKDELVAALHRDGRPSRRPGPAPELPPTSTFDGWAARLLSSPEPLRYLTDDRGISLDVIEAARVGWDGNRLRFPSYLDGEVVAAKWRRPRPGAQMRSLPGKGRPWPLYPAWLLPANGTVLLVAGELDALAGLSAGLAAVSLPLGAGTWRTAWTDALQGRRVVGCFDNNETDLARAAVERLRSAGIYARRLDLRRLGLGTPKGDLTDYVLGGGSVRQLKAAVR